MKIKNKLIIIMIIGLGVLYIIPCLYSTFFKQVEVTVPFYDEKGRQMIG